MAAQMIPETIREGDPDATYITSSLESGVSPCISSVETPTETSPQIRDEDFNILLVFRYMYAQEVPLGVGLLDAYLSKHGYPVEQFGLNQRSALLDTLKRFSPLSTEPLEFRYQQHLNRQLSRYVDTGRGGAIKRKLDTMLDEMKAGKRSLVGFSLKAKPQLMLYLALAKRLKERWDVPVVFGGAYVKLFHELVDMRKYGFIDYMITSDGEMASLELVKYLQGRHDDINMVPSLKYQDGGRLVMTEQQLADLSDSPVSKLDTKQLERINAKFCVTGGLPYEMAKGCPFRCSFCAYPALNKYKRKEIDTIIRDLRTLTGMYHCTKIRFSDASINGNPRFLADVCDRIVSERLDIKWVANCTPNLSPELVSRMRDAGCSALIFGLETGSPKINRLMRKSVLVDKAERCILDAAKARIKPIVNLIIGFPHENEEDVRQSIDFVLRNKDAIHQVHVHHFQLTQRTPLFENPERWRIRIRGVVSDVNFDTFRFDEIDGLPWERKVKQTDKHVRMVRKALKKNGIEHAVDRRVV